MNGELEPYGRLVRDTERAQAAQLLRRALGHGWLTPDEFDHRMAAAMAARTRGDLDVLVADIAVTHPGPAGPAAGELVMAPRQDLVLHDNMGDISRRGRWVAPAVIKVNSGLGQVMLDFSQAQLTSSVTTIMVNVGMGDLRIVIPEDASIDLNEVYCTVGTVKDRTERFERAVNAPHFVVRGTITTGDVKVQHPRSWSFGLFTVHSPFRITWGRAERY